MADSWAGGSGKLRNHRLTVHHLPRVMFQRDLQHVCNMALEVLWKTKMSLDSKTLKLNLRLYLHKTKRRFKAVIVWLLMLIVSWFKFRWTTFERSSVSQTLRWLASINHHNSESVPIRWITAEFIWHYYYFKYLFSNFVLMRLLPQSPWHVNQHTWIVTEVITC